MILTSNKKVVKPEEKVKRVDVGLLPNMRGVCLHILSEKKVEIKVSTSLNGKDFVDVKKIKADKGLTIEDLTDALLFSWLRIELNKADTGCEIILCHGSK